MKPLPHLILPLLILFLAVYPAPGSLRAASDLSTNPEKIGPGVVLKLEKGLPARVVIALADPASPAAGPSSLPLQALNQQVASLQAAVLSTLSPAVFAPLLQFQSVPALVGELRSLTALAQLASHPAVQRVDLDTGGSGGLALSVPFIGANTWQNAYFTGQGIHVAVLDSGLDTDHQDLAPALYDQACFLDNGGTINGLGLCPNGSDRQFGPGAAEDDAGHGTHVSGIIASRGVRSSVGVAPGAEILAIKVTAGPTFSGVFYFFSEIVAALDFIINNRPEVNILNMSLGTNSTFPGDCDNATAYTIAGASAINTLRANGVIAFASAGNQGSTTEMTAPACLSNVIAVGSSNFRDEIATSSNRNAATDLFAPGVGIVSDYLNNLLIIASGTSMASPHAAGCAALLLDAGLASTPAQVEAAIEASPVRITDLATGLTYPRLDCRLAPMNQLILAGPAAGLKGFPLQFQASILPVNATRPITYTWEASGQVPIVHPGGSSDQAAFTWNIAGMQQITVTVQNYAGELTTFKSVLINDLYGQVFLPSVLR